MTLDFSLYPKPQTEIKKMNLKMCNEKKKKKESRLHINRRTVRFVISFLARIQMEEVAVFGST